MGSSSSKGKAYAEGAKYGELYVQTDKTTYYGGETVTGRIYLNLVAPFPGNQLLLKFKGKETTYTVERRQHRNGNHTTYHEILHSGKNQIINMSVPVYSWPTLSPGQYTIPFAFLLPYDLPNSFHQEGYRYLGNISYRVEAILSPTEKKGPKMKHKQALVLRQQIKNAQQGSNSAITTKLKTCCCCSQGTNILRASFEKNFYAPGETAVVQMQLDNGESKIDTSTMRLAIVQKVLVRATGYARRNNLIKVKQELAGLKKGSTGDPNLVSVQLPSFVNADVQSVKRKNMRGYLLSLGEAGLLNSETKGKLISSEYFLEVSCDMNGCCATKPSISLPISIYYPEIALVPIVAPANWNPQEIGLVNLNFGNAEMAASPQQMSPLQAGYLQQEPKLIQMQQAPQQGGSAGLQAMSYGNDMNVKPQDNQYNTNYYSSYS